jgi:hypothetical protein
VFIVRFCSSEGQAQAALTQARSQQQLDETNLKRSQDLFSKGGVDQQDLDVAITTVKNDLGKTLPLVGMVPGARPRSRSIPAQHARSPRTRITSRASRR